MQVKITMRYHLASDNRMAIINKTRNNKCWRGCGEMVTSYTAHSALFSHVFGEF